jgi:beta-glucosidase
MRDSDSRLGSAAELLLPAVRWDEVRGFGAGREVIETGLRLGVGGFIFFGGPQDEVRALTKELRQRSRTPLLFGADLERGAGQQFTGATGLPPLAAIASLDDESSIRRAAKLTAREARTIGINWDYAPVCDLDVEPLNPIVGTRALGADPRQVARLATAWIEACQLEGVLACAKHFPGHGRTRGDSHVELPRVDADRQTLLEQDVEPFRAAMKAGVASIMTAHVSYPALDASGAPATLSRDILRYFLRERLGYDGLVVTDALIMEGVLAGQGEGDAAVRALDAGCDLLLYPTDTEAVARSIEQAVAEHRLDEPQLYRAMRRRLKWAQWASPPTDYRRASQADVQWAGNLCERVITVVRGEVPALGEVVDVVVVDDDVGGPYAPPSREPFFEAMRAAGRPARRVDAPTEGARAPVVVALFGDIRGWKRRAGYSAESRRAVATAVARATALGREAIVVQFSHSRLAAELAEARTVVCAWGGERAMQEAAARWLARR